MCVVKMENKTKNGYKTLTQANMHNVREFSHIINIDELCYLLNMLDPRETDLHNCSLPQTIV